MVAALNHILPKQGFENLLCLYFKFTIKQSNFKSSKPHLAFFAFYSFLELENYLSDWHFSAVLVYCSACGRAVVSGSTFTAL